MAAVTMMDLAKGATTPLDKNVRFLSALKSPILGDAKIVVIDTQSRKYDRFVDNYGVPAFSNLGEGFNSIKSLDEQIECTTYSVGFNIDVDRRLKGSDQNIDPRVKQLRAGMIGYAAFVNGKIFDADPNSPGAGVGNGPAAPFKGAKWFLDFPSHPEGARLDGTMKIDSVAFNGAAAIDLRPPVSSPNARSFMRLMDQIRYQMYHAKSEGKKVTFYFPTELMIALPDIMRAGGAFNTAADQFGRSVDTYGEENPSDLKDAGLAAPSLTPLSKTTSAARVIGWEDINGVRSDTLAPGGAGTYTSIWAFEHDEDGFLLYSKGGQQSQDLGLLNDGVTYRQQVSDQLGLCFVNPWCVCRAYGLRIG